MPFFIKTEIIKKEYLINHDLKQKIINEHIDCHVRLSMKNEEEQRTA